MTQLQMERISPICRRCGYRYNPADPDRNIIIMPGPTGEVYVGCRDCIEALGSALTQAQRQIIIDSMKVRVN